MPYKFNETRRHKIPRAKYRVTNWPEYDAALIKRGSLTIWITEEAVAAWQAPATGKRGGQPIYSAIAIETSLALRLVFHQPLRQTEGLLRSIADVLKLDIAIPDHTTLSRSSVDRRVGQEVLKVIAPLGVEASLRALEELSADGAAQRAALSRKLEQLVYEARKAV
jgi:Transposase DDE domain